MVVLGSYTCGSIYLPTNHDDTQVKYTPESGLADLSLDIRGTLASNSIPNKEYILELRIGNTVTSIAESVFRACERMTYLELPDNLLSIGNFAVYGCKGLTNMTIPPSVTHIGNQSFDSCSNIRNLYFLDGLKIIGYRAFGACSIVTVEIPDTVTTIGISAFESCKQLTSIVFGKGLTQMNNRALQSCPSLQNVTFKGKTLAQVQGMSNYPWGIADTSIINVA